MEELNINNLIQKGILPQIYAHKEEDDSIVVEWIFPDFRIGLNIEKDKKESGWHVVSKQITASGPLFYERTEIYINTDGMRKLAKSVKEGQGTRVGSIAKMLIDCCDRIDRLTTELKAKDEEIARLKELLSAVEHVYPGRFNIEQALKAEDKDNG